MIWLDKLLDPARPRARARPEIGFPSSILRDFGGFGGMANLDGFARTAVREAADRWDESASKSPSLQQADPISCSF